jgi:formamidopyrimidine-DNA glycosylase
MPELPEIYHLSKQMENELVGKQITDIEVLQEKCLNIGKEEFVFQISNKTIQSISSLGKWIFIGLDADIKLALSLGMGGDVIYHKDAASPLPDKYQFKITFADKSCLTIRFWWFGYFHLVKAEEDSHKQTYDLGVSPLDKFQFTYEYFNNMLNDKRGSIKSFLMDQKNVAGIGNVYIQDILFRAKIRPDRKINTLDDSEKSLLYNAIREELEEAVKLGGIVQERDLYNRPGKKCDFLVGYKEGRPCPVCGTEISKITVANTACYICSSCQK